MAIMGSRLHETSGTPADITAQEQQRIIDAIESKSG
jgi:hypothetical protein